MAGSFQATLVADGAAAQSRVGWKWRRTPLKGLDSRLEAAAARRRGRRRFAPELRASPLVQIAEIIPGNLSRASCPLQSGRLEMAPHALEKARFAAGYDSRARRPAALNDGGGDP
jgi:hypothetical protein